MKHAITKDFLRPNQIIKRRRRQRILKSVYYFVATLIVLGLFVLVMRLDFFKIKLVHVTGNISIKSEEINFAVNNILSGNYFYVIPKNNILVYPKDEIAEVLARDFPRLENIDISASRSEVAISVSERKPEALWCGQSFSEDMGVCSFIDSTGFVFAQAPQFDGSSYLKMFGDNINGASSVETVMATSSSELAVVNEEVDIISESLPVLGWQFISAEEYRGLVDFIKKTKTLGIELIAVEISDDGNYKFEIKDNGLILVNRKIDLSSTLENLKAGLSNQLMWKKSSSKGQKTLAAFEYIDLRYNNKIFYKYSGN